jgi:hypothetical protein
MRLITITLLALLWALPAAGQTLPHSGAAHLTENATQNYVTANEMGNRVDDATQNHLAIAMADADVTLTDTQQWGSAFIELTGANTAVRSLILNGDEKRLTVWNNTTGGFDVTVKYATGGVVSVSPNVVVLLHGDGTDILQAAQFDIAQLPPAGSVNPAEDRFAMWDASTDTLTYLLGDDLPGSGGGGGGAASGGPALRLFHVREELPDGTDAGGSTGGTWHTRALNTVVTNEIAGATLVGNQINLPAGNYYISANSPALIASNITLRLRNITDGTDVLRGLNQFTSTSDNVTIRALMFERFSLAATKTLEVQLWVQSTKAVNGLGAASNEDSGTTERYTDVRIWQIDGTSFRDFENQLANGDFQVCQRGGSACNFTAPADDSFTLDRIINLVEGTGGADHAQETTVVPGAPGATTALKITAQTANDKLGFAQILPADLSSRLIGGNASLSFLARSPAANPIANLRACILVWTGTADAVTSDVVSAWGLPGTNPTLATSWACENSPADLAVTADAYGQVKVVNIAIDTAGAKNVGVFIWVDEDSAIGDILYITDLQLEPASFASGYDRRSFEAELAASERFYRKSFPYATAPAQNAGTAGAVGYRGHVAGVNADGLQVQFGRRMFAAPTVTFYNPSAANALWRNATDIGDSGAATADLASEHGFFARNAQVATDGAGEQLLIHYAAAAEL